MSSTLPPARPAASAADAGAARPGSAAAPETAATLAGVRFLRSFDGLEPGPDILAAIRAGRTSGVTFFRGRNVATPAQVRGLCAALQAARPAGDPPLVIGLDQEGGQLQTVGDGATPWPGNLALAATGSEELTRRAGRAIGDEVAALGGTLVYAPVCDVLHRASATPLGTRPFGDDPARAAGLVAAIVAGFQESGIAATLKHFPGHGAAAADSHRALPVIDHDLAELRAAELPPFEAGIAAGAMAVMPGHLAVPALTGGVAMPATVSPAILGGLLRRELGFGGVTISDALDMAGASSGGGLADTVMAATEAGVDLLLMNHPAETENAAFEGLRVAIAGGRLGRPGLEAARGRILAMRRHFDDLVQPPIEVVGGEEHLRLAREIAAASVTLVRDPARVLPLRPESAGRGAVIAPALVDLTPAETSSYLQLGLAAALRTRGLDVAEIAAPLDPSPAEVAFIVAAAAEFRTVIVCTFDAVSFAGQVALVERLAGALPGQAGAGAATATAAQAAPTAPRRIVAVALRSPYDVATFPDGVAAACTYGVQPPQIEALADALTGRARFVGSLPVSLEAAS